MSRTETFAAIQEKFTPFPFNCDPYYFSFNLLNQLQ